MAHSNFNAVLAKARAMYGKRISPAQYEELLHCKNVREVAAILKAETSYSAELAHLSESELHRGRIEDVLHHAFFNRCDLLFFYEPQRNGTLFEYFLRESEIFEVLKMVSLLQSGNPDKFIYDIPEHLLHRGRINFLELSQVQSFEELIQYFKEIDPHLAELLTPFKTEDDRNLNLLAIEQSLWTDYYTDLFQKCSNEPKEELDLIKFRIELLNLQNLYRNTVHLHLTDEDLSLFLMPWHYKINDAQMLELMKASNEEQFWNLLRRIPFYSKVELEPNESIEHFADRIFTARCRHVLHFTTDSDLCFYAYLLLLKQEFKNIVTLLEGVRYQMPESEIRKLLII